MVLIQTFLKVCTQGPRNTRLCDLGMKEKRQKLFIKLVFNYSHFQIEDNPSQARIMTGVREGFYTDKELKEWIEHGKIKEFKR